MRREKLSSLCKISNGYAFKSDDYVKHGHRVMRITNVQKGVVVDADPKFISNEIADKVHNFKLNVGDILVSLTGNVGRVGRVLKKHLPAVLNQRVGLIRPISSEINEKYLFQFLNSDRFEREAIQNSNGVAQLNLSSKWLENYDIPLPPLNEQIRIAYLLGKVEELIIQRKQHLKQLDDLLKSIFFDMFGDPVRNEKKWEKKLFSELLLDIESGTSPKCEARIANEEEWGVLKLGAVTSCFFKEEENKALPANVKPNEKDEVRAGDLLFTRKNTYDLVAACAYVFNTRKKLLMPDLVFRFAFKEQAEVNPIFFWKLLTADSQRKKIQSLAAGAAGSMPNISKGNLRQTILIVPPINQQNKFAEIVRKTERIKSYYQQSLSDFENLYRTLSLQAFNGELDLSTITLIEQSTLQNNLISHVLPPENANKDVIKENTPNLATTEGRINLLRNIFIKSFNDLRLDDEFNVDMLWLDVLGTSLEFVDENSGSFGTDEYEQLKKWIFEMLGAGRLKQSYFEGIGMQLYKLAD